MIGDTLALKAAPSLRVWQNSAMRRPRSVIFIGFLALIALTAVGVPLLLHFLRLHGLSATDASSYTTAEATALLAVLTAGLAFVTWRTMEESQRQSRETTRREHLERLRMNGLPSVRGELGKFFGPMFASEPQLPFERARGDLERGRPKPFAPDFAVESCLRAHFPKLMESVDTLNTRYVERFGPVTGLAPESTVWGRIQRIAQKNCEEGFRLVAQEDRWSGQIAEICYCLGAVKSSDIVGPVDVGLPGQFRIQIVRKGIDGWTIELGDQKDVREQIKKCIDVTFDEVSKAVHNEIVALEALYRTCNQEIDRAHATTVLHGNCDLTAPE